MRHARRLKQLFGPPERQRLELRLARYRRVLKHYQSLDRNLRSSWRCEQADCRGQSHGAGRPQTRRCGVVRISQDTAARAELIVLTLKLQLICIQLKQQTLRGRRVLVRTVETGRSGISFHVACGSGDGGSRFQTPESLGRPYQFEDAVHPGRWANAPAAQISIVALVQLFRPFVCYRHPIFVQSSKIGTIGRIPRGLAGRTLIDQNGVVLTVLYRWTKFL